ncbi:immunoglobulin lambda-1 light chain [Amia ocellicauda]|uniref:immunoglobulin lambda-1 light chain n=1 Tax=Amia ocellicauda TaxID=2972642 RepID=UPI003464BDE8
MKMFTAQVLILFLSVTFIHGEAVLSQSPTVVSVSPGEKVILECSVKNGNVDTLYMQWIRQTPGKKPEGVMGFKKGQINRPSAIPNRFFPSTNTARSSFVLTVSNIQEEDDSVYYCFLFYGSSGIQSWGEGTRIKVLKSGLPRPIIQLFPPPKGESSSADSVTLTCLVSGFFPGFIEVKWSMDGAVVTEGVHTSPVSLGSIDGNTYVVSSYMKLPATDWETHNVFSCTALHESSQTPVTGSITKDKC